MTTIFEALRDDHDKHRTLLALVAKTQGDSEGRRELFAKLKRELEHHAAAEEKAFYTQLLDEHDTQDHSRHSIAEHEKIDKALAELEEIELSNPAWLIKYKQLRHDVEHHMEEEERDVFPAADAVLGEAQKSELAQVFFGSKGQLDQAARSNAT